MATKYASLYDRLVANTREDEDGCWIWTGNVKRRYPAMTMRERGCPYPKVFRPHRLMLELATGYAFPFDEAGHYRCFKPLCIRPECLRIETKAENLSTRRGYADTKTPGRWIPVLFPTEKRLREEAEERSLEATGIINLPCEDIPF